MVGLIISITVMVNEQVAEFPAVSVAVWVIVCTPTGNDEPEAIPAVLIGVIGLQLSITVTL